MAAQTKFFTEPMSAQQGSLQISDGGMSSSGTTMPMTPPIIIDADREKKQAEASYEFPTFQVVPDSRQLH